MQESDHVQRILKLANDFNQAIADAQQDNLIIDFHARSVGYGSELAADKIEVRSIYKALHTQPRPRAGEDF